MLLRGRRGCPGQMSHIRVTVAGQLAELTRYQADVRRWGRWKRAGQVETIETSYGFYVQGLFVELQYRRQGVATRLMRRVIRAARGRRIELICTPASTDMTGAQLADFYRGFGFEYAPPAGAERNPMESDTRRMARLGRNERKP